MNFMTFMSAVYPWLDLFWVPVALLIAEKGKRLLTTAYVLGCVFMLRLQVELLQGIGKEKGFLGFMDSDIYVRGLAVYSAFIALFLILARLSHGTDKNVHMAASITFLIVSFCISSIIMVL